jgi:hypothetical protein
MPAPLGINANEEKIPVRRARMRRLQLRKTLQKHFPDARRKREQSIARDQPAYLGKQTSDCRTRGPPYSRADKLFAVECSIDVIESHMRPHHVAKKQFEHFSAQSGIGEVKAKDRVVAKSVRKQANGPTDTLRWQQVNDQLIQDQAPRVNISIGEITR